MKRIMWVDLVGQYRVTSIAIRDGETEDDALVRAWAKVRAHYRLPDDHPHHFIERDVYRAHIEANCEGIYFRYAGIEDAEGRRTGVNGAWAMGDDGLPIVSMDKARAVQMDYIRTVRNKELEKLDLPQSIAVGKGDNVERDRIETEKQTLRDIPATFDVTTDAGTPGLLKAKWPAELPDRE